MSLFRHHLRRPGAAIRAMARGAAGWWARLWNDLRPRWRGLPAGFTATLRTSLLIAIAIELLLHAAHHHPRLQHLEDLAMDWVVGIHRGTGSALAGSPPAFTYLDIDDETFRRWGEPLFVPRDRLRRLIGAVLVARPAALIVDVDLGRAASTPGERALESYLADLASGPPPSDARPTPLILPANLAPRAGAGAGARHREEHRELPLLRRTGLRRRLAATTDGAVSVLWASTLFHRSEDWVIRRWRLWQAACDPQAPAGREPVIVPSIQLLVTALRLNPGQRPATVAESLERQIAPSVSALCPEAEAAPGQTAGRREGPSGHDGAPAAIALGGGVELQAAPSRLEQRIVYRYVAPERLRPGESYPVHPETGEPLLNVFPAYPITDGLTPRRGLFAGRIVVIGGSYREGRDIHRTPVGPMPGPLILINAMDSLASYGQLRELTWPWRYLITIGLVLLMSVSFALFHSVKAVGCVTLVLIAVLLPICVWFFRQGYWIQFVLPMLGVLLHKIAADVEALGHHDAGADR